MDAKWLKEIMKDLPDNAPIVMLIHYNEREDGLMAQVKLAYCVYGNDEDPRMHLLLTAYWRDVINDGRLKPADDSAGLPAPELRLLGGRS